MDGGNGREARAANAVAREGLCSRSRAGALARLRCAHADLVLLLAALARLGRDPVAVVALAPPLPRVLAEHAAASGAGQSPFGAAGVPSKYALLPKFSSSSAHGGPASWRQCCAGDSGCCRALTLVRLVRRTATAICIVGRVDGFVGKLLIYFQRVQARLSSTVRSKRRLIPGKTHENRERARG